MPSHDARRVSRRSVLQGAATAGAAGLAATALGAAVSPAAAASESAPRGTGAGAAKPASGPLVVHVRDARSGDIEVFSGTSQVRLRDKDLAARISRAFG